MTWTTEPPQDSGYYWWRYRKGFIPQIVYLLWEGCFFQVAADAPNRLLVEHWADKIDRAKDAKTYGGEWAGPIPEPEDA